MKYMQFNLSYVSKPNVLLKMMEGGCPNYFQMLPSKGIGLDLQALSKFHLFAWVHVSQNLIY